MSYVMFVLERLKHMKQKQRWDGFIVCPDDFETRQPQDFVKAQTDKITVPFTRPIPTEILLLFHIIYIGIVNIQHQIIL